MSVFSFYFKLTDGSLWSFNHAGKENPSFDNAEGNQTLNWDLLPMFKVQNEVLLYTNFEIFSYKVGMKYKTFAAICHTRFVSMFNITDWKWVNHLEFEDEIDYLFTHDSYSSLYPSVVTKTGMVFIDIMADNRHESLEVFKESAYTNHKIEGYIKCTEDLDNQKMLYLLNKVDGKLSCSML